MKCKLCKFYKTFGKTAPGGICHRYPPMNNISFDGIEYGVWPVVFSKDWCGEYQFADDKLHTGKDAKP